MKHFVRVRWILGLFCANLMACQTTSGDSHFAIVDATTGAPVLELFSGDAITLSVVQVAADGSTHSLPSGTDIVWSGANHVSALDPNDTTTSALPSFTSQPTAIWLSNPGRPDRASDLANVLFVLDRGGQSSAVLNLSAAFSSAGVAGRATASISILSTPSGDPQRGATVYGQNCASCHGATGAGSVAVANGDYRMADSEYSYPAPGLNADPGNAGSDPSWDAAVFAVSARADIDNQGVTLRLPMPDWLSAVSPSTNAVLSTQDFADIFSFLQTQTSPMGPSGATGPSGPSGPSGTPSGPSGPSAPTVTGFAIDIGANVAATEITVGDALPLEVVETLSDGTTASLPTGATVSWTGATSVTALDPSSTAASPIPSFGTEPTAIWIQNPQRTDEVLSNVLFLLDGGTVAQPVVTLTALVTGVLPTATPATANLTVLPLPAGSSARGELTYSANCAGCHGSIGQGGFGPGLNGGPGNDAAAGSGWTAALFAMSARADIDNGGLCLPAPMPNWLESDNANTSALLTTQDFADMWVYLQGMPANN